MARIFQGRRILLGVSGGIAAYKAVEVARSLTLEGALVDVALTRAAREFVTPLTFQALTRRRVYTDVFEPWTPEEAGHVSLGAEADAVLVAPATANVIAKLAHGLADDMLTVSALATTAPLIVAPAMEHHMYLHPATQANLRTLESRGARVVGPEEGPLASGASGYGRLAAPERLVAAVRAALATGGPLAGVRVVVTAGPTREPIDPIRFISNRSSGKMGYAIAQAALDAGAHVTLISGPTAIAPPSEASVVQVETALEMAEAVDRTVEDARVLIMTAAVADYRPVEVAAEKIKKQAEDISLTLTRTIDILASIQRPGLLKVGFAAETAHLLQYAEDKLRRKGVDLLIANEARSTMGSDQSQAYLLQPGSPPERLPLLHKDALAELIVERVAALLRGSGSETAARREE